MKKFRKILIVAAILVGAGGAFAFERPDLLGVSRFSCGETVYPQCLGFTQYVLSCTGDFVLAPQGGEGISWVCKYNNNKICTYAYMYCGQYGPQDWRFMPCRKGEFCFFNPDYTCEPCPPWSFLSGGKDSVIKPTEFQRGKMEEATKAFLDQ